MTRPRSAGDRNGLRRRSPRLSRCCCALVQSGGEQPPEDHVIRTMVPVSVRRRGEKGVYNNRVSAVFAGLPVGLLDPSRRLAQIRAEMDGVKQSKQAVAG